MYSRNPKSALALAVAPAALVLCLVGCSSSKSNPAVSSDNQLTALAITGPGGPMTLAPAFTTGTLAYSFTIGGTGPISVTATTSDPSATVHINNVLTPSGSASAPIPLTIGSNTILVEIKAQDGTYKYYNITVKALSQNASLAALSVKSGNGGIAPAFAQTTMNYTVATNFAANPTAMTVTATLADPAATMTVNGVSTASNTPSAAIAVKPGASTIPVVITAPDGVTTKTYNIAYTNYAQNTTVRVQDSSNGAVVPGALVTVADAAGTVLQAGIPVDANGNATLGLDGVSKYNLSAMAPGTAQSLYANFDSSRETAVNFYCHPLGMLNFPAQAPQISALSYGPDGTAWTPVVGNVMSDTLANAARLKVTALGASNIAATSWSGFGMGLQVDQPAWAWAYNGAYAIDEQAVAVTAGTATLYRSTMELGVPLLNFAANSNHYVDLVVYDVANNRTETKLYLNITDGAANTTHADLSTFTPSKITVQTITHGLSRNIFSITPVDGNPVTYEPDIFFSLLNASGTVQKITGYEIYRSTDAVAWTKVGTHQYTALTNANGLVYTDLDPNLTQGVLYYYKVRAFNGNTTNNGGYSQYSSPVASFFLPPFTTRLASPATESVTRMLAPKLAFTITNPTLWDPAVCDYFYFNLNVTEKTNSSASYAQAYRYNFIANRFEASIGGVWTDASSTVSVDAAHATISIQMPTGYFMAGVTYQWTISGPLNSQNSATASSFRKYTYPYNDPTSTSYGVALSQGSTYELSFGAVNGYFTLTIDPNAQ